MLMGDNQPGASGGLESRTLPTSSRQAVLDADGTIAPTFGQCKQDEDISYDGTMGLSSAADLPGQYQEEPLYLVNRPGQPPQPRAGRMTIWTRRPGPVPAGRGSRQFLLRGDTDFEQTLEAGWMGRCLRTSPSSSGPMRSPVARGGQSRVWSHSSGGGWSVRPEYEVQTQEREQAAQRQGAGGAGTRASRLLSCSGRMWPSSMHAPARPVPPQAVSDGGVAQAASRWSRDKGESRFFDDVPLLLLHHQRSRERGRRKSSLCQRPLRSGKPHWPAQERRVKALTLPRTAWSGTGPIWSSPTGLDSEGLECLDAARIAATLGGTAQGREAVRCLRMEFATVLAAPIPGALPDRAKRAGRLIYRLLSWKPRGRGHFLATRRSAAASCCAVLEAERP